MPQHTLDLPPMFDDEGAASPSPREATADPQATATYEVAAARDWPAQETADEVPAATVEVRVSDELLAASGRRSSDTDVLETEEAAGETDDATATQLHLRPPARGDAHRDGDAAQASPVGPSGPALRTSAVAPVAVGELPGRETSIPSQKVAAPRGDKKNAMPTPLWDEPPRKREIPLRVRLGLGALVAVIALAFLARHLGSSKTTTTKLQLRDDLVVHEKDLKDRREVTEEDFRAGASSEEDSRFLVAPPNEETLEERRSRRGADPEDLLTLRRRPSHTVRVPRPGMASTEASTAPLVALSSRKYPPPFVEPLPRATPFDDSSSFRAPPSRTSGARGQDLERSSAPRRLASAGTPVPAVLITPLRIPSGGSTPVVASASSGPFPKGTRFLGTATTSDEDRFILTFRRLVLPDGQELPIAAEAQDTDGFFGLAALIEGPREDAGESGGAAKEALKETATDVMLGALGGGIAGQAASNYLDASRDERGRRRRRNSAIYALPSGVEFTLFLSQGVVPRR